MQDPLHAWAVCPDVVTRRLGDTLVAVSLSSNRIFELNETGSRIWALVADGSSDDQVVSTLVQEFEVTDQVARQELEGLRARLLAAGLIEKHDAG